MPVFNAAKIIADTILEQLGGPGRLKAFLGIKGLILIDRPETKEKGLAFRFPNPGGKPNYVEIILDEAQDLYNLNFFKLGKHTAEKKQSYEGIYFDQLVELFEETTGLFLHF